MDANETTPKLPIRQRDAAHPAHLGGHHNVTHIDEGAVGYLFELLADRGALVYPAAGPVLLDVGCGVCGMMDVVERLGGDWFGIDGVELENPPYAFARWDFYRGPFPDVYPFDLDVVWSTEFLEHVAEPYLVNVLSVFRQGTVVACTANEGAGPLHPSAHPVGWWIEWFEANGFEYLEAETAQMKARSTMQREFMAGTGMLFYNRLRGERSW